MTLITDIAKKTSADFSKYFDFLTKDFGMKMLSESYSTVGGDKYVRILRNQFVQVELAGDQHFFHSEIRRLVEGEPRSYSDGDNNIGFESLAVLKTNNNYDHMSFYVASAGWQTVLTNTARLFKECPEVFTTDKWVDIARIEKLKGDEMEQKFGFRPDKNKLGFFDIVKQKVSDLLIKKGFVKTFDNAEFPHYGDNHSPEKIAFKKGETEIVISQRDWRDFYNEYFVQINGKRVFDVDLTTNKDINISAKVILTEIDRHT